MSLTLYLRDREVECRGGSLSIQVQTERWVERKIGPIQLPGKWDYDPSLAYAIIELEVDVDEASGDDGKPAPRVVIEITPGRWKFASIRQISGSSWTESDGVKVVGWYGNDAPEIEQSSILFGEWRDGQTVAVEWTGYYRWRPSDPAETFRLAGSVEFAGLSLSVKDQVDVGRFLVAALPGFSLIGLDPQLVEKSEFGPEMPDLSRRKWERHSWTVSQTPLT